MGEKMDFSGIAIKFKALHQNVEQPQNGEGIRITKLQIKYLLVGNMLRNSVPPFLSHQNIAPTALITHQVLFLFGRHVFDNRPEPFLELRQFILTFTCGFQFKVKTVDDRKEDHNSYLTK